MAPAKRARPSFSPPRPGKPKSKSASKSNSTKGIEKGQQRHRDTTAVRRRAAELSKKSRDKYEGRKGTRQALLSGDEDEDDDQDDEEEEEFHRQRGRGKIASALIVDEASADNDDDDDRDEHSDEEEETLASSRRNQRRAEANSSPEPDMILAEITHHSAPTTPSPIPEQLVHKMLTHHFEQPEKTKMSTNARDLVTKYFEVFVREAIMRSAFERQERDKNDGSGGGVKVGGFLEVEDLERAAVQLCLDF